ncbi:hypothetical protein Tco_1222327 [Tanacetum coccineum]
MLAVTAPSTSPSRITSSPSHSPEPLTQHSPKPTLAHQPSPTQPSPTLASPGTEHHFPKPHDSPLHAVHSHGSDEGSLKHQELINLVTTLSDRIGELEGLELVESRVSTQDSGRNARHEARVVLSDDEVIEDDSSKQGRKLSEEEEVTPTEVIQDQEGSEKRSDEISTTGAKKGTATKEVPIVSIAKVNLSTARGTVTYTRRSAEKSSRQDKGKAIMIGSEPKKKSKKEIEQERLSFAEAIRLKEQMNEDKRAQIARDKEIAR